MAQISRFAAFCAEHWANQLSRHPDFAGRVGFEVFGADAPLDLHALPADVDKLWIENDNPCFFRWLADNPRALEGRAVEIGQIVVGPTPSSTINRVDSTIAADNPRKAQILDILDRWWFVFRLSHGPFPLADAVALIDWTLEYLLSSGIKNPRILEVGSAVGTSSSVLGMVIKSLGLEGRVYCVDPWETNEICSHLHYVTLNRTYSALASWRLSQKLVGTDDICRPIKCYSEEVYRLFGEQIFDVVFIDADHRYPGVFNDISNSLRLVKEGGVIIGHDGRYYEDEVSPEFFHHNFDNHFGAMNEEGHLVHPGVICALKDVFGRNYEIYPGSSVWRKKTDRTAKELRPSMRAR